MLPFKITTKWITIEVFRRGIVFSVASILLTSGVSLCNEEIIIALISIFNNQIFHNDCDNYSLFVGLFLILVSLFLFYLLIINWRKEIYSKLFIEMRKAIDSFGTTWRTRIRYASSATLRPLHTKAYSDYTTSLQFLYENQTLIDVETYDRALGFLNLIGEEILYFDNYIRDLEKKELDISHNFDPNRANRETEEKIAEITEQFRGFVDLIKIKEKYRIK